MKCEQCGYQRTLKDGPAAGCPKCGFGAPARSITRSTVKGGVTLETTVPAHVKPRFKGFWGLIEGMAGAFIVLPLMSGVLTHRPANPTALQQAFVAFCMAMPAIGIAALLGMQALRRRIREQPELFDRYMTSKAPLGYELRENIVVKEEWSRGKRMLVMLGGGILFWGVLLAGMLMMRR